MPTTYMQVFRVSQKSFFCLEWLASEPFLREMVVFLWRFQRHKNTTISLEKRAP